MAETVGLVSPLNRARFVREIGPCSCTRSRTRERLSSRGGAVVRRLVAGTDHSSKTRLSRPRTAKARGRRKPSCHESARGERSWSPALLRSSPASPARPLPAPPRLSATSSPLPLAHPAHRCLDPPTPRGASELLMSASQSPLSRDGRRAAPSRLPRSKLPRFGGWAPTARTSVWRNVASPLVRWKQGARGPLGVRPARTWRSPRSPLPRRRKDFAAGGLISSRREHRLQTATNDKRWMTDGRRSSAIDVNERQTANAGSEQTSSR